MTKRLTLEELKQKANEIHNFTYDYSLITNHINCHTPYKIICKKHGVFEQIMNVHINQKCGCPKCANEEQSTRQQVPLIDTLNKFKLVHGNKYDYSLVTGIPTSFEKIEIICYKHGIFRQDVSNHIQGHGCPKCKESKGERLIRKWLESHNIAYEYNKWFSDCRGKRKPLPFDFFVESCNLCIEFDGEQHYRKYNWMSDIKFNDRQNNDKTKTEYCNKKGIRLLRIPFTEIKNVDSILSTYFSNLPATIAVPAEK